MESKEYYTIEEIKQEENALEQCSALTRITLSMLNAQKKTNKMLLIALIVSILINLAVTGISAYVITGFGYEEITTTTQEIDGDSSINNVKGDQYTDDAVHNDDK